MFWVSRMKLRKFSVLLSSVLLSVVGCAVVTPPDNVTVLVNGLSGILQCVLQQGDSVTWLDSTEVPSVAIFGGVVGSDNIQPGQDAGPGTKYENFYIDSPTGSAIFNLNITNAEFMEDEGLYTCQPQLSSGAASTVSIEVPTDQVTLSCESCNGDNAESTCQCTCLAEGGYPSSLTIGWATTAGSIGTSSMEPAKERNGKYDFTGTADVTITENMAVVTCSVTGYVNQGVVEENFSDKVSQEQVLASPTNCALVVSEEAGETSDGGCTVQLTCSCQGVPPINSCKFYTGTQDNEIPGEDSCVTNHTVQLGTEAIFLCSGSNGINFVDDVSDTVSYKCLESTTILPTTSEPTSDTTSLDITTNSTANNAQPTGSTTTTKKDNGTGTENGGGSNKAGLIAGLCVLGVVCVIIGGVIVFFIVSKRGCCEKCTEEKNDKTDGNGMPMSEAPEYAAVDKPLNSEPKPAPRSSQPPPNNSTEKQELQYADIDHSSRTPSNQIRQPAEAPTEYATVQSVIV